MDAGVWALEADRIFDGEKILTAVAVIVRGDRIEKLLPSADVPPGVPRHCIEGSTILPGLIDVHAHFACWEGPLFLAYGVTTIRDTGNALDWILARRAEWPRQCWPRIYCLGPILDGPRPFHRELSRACFDRASAVAAVQATASAGVDGIKLYVGLDPAWIAPMVEAGHAAGRKVSLHSGGGVLRAGQAGVDEFFHLDGLLNDLWPDHPAGWLELWGRPEFACTRARQSAVADAIAGMSLVATPTLAYWDSQERIRKTGYTCAEDSPHVPRAVIASQRGAAPDPAGAVLWRRALEAARDFTGLLLERGVRILAGSDVPCGAVPPGLSLWRELALLVDAGMTPIAALQSATVAAAQFMDQPALGCIRPGAQADLIGVRGDPTRTIPADPEMTLIMRAGKRFSRETLLEAAQTAEATLLTEPLGVQWWRKGESSPLPDARGSA